MEELKDCVIVAGAQNAHWEEKGAYTGEISVGMLKDIGVRYVVVGHSERRQYFGETDETVNKRTLAVMAGGLVPISCIGETAERITSMVLLDFSSMVVVIKYCPLLITEISRRMANAAGTKRVKADAPSPCSVSVTVMACGSRDVVRETRTVPEEPSNSTALPDSPGVQVTPPVKVPSLPFPELSWAIVPVPSSNLHRPMGPPADIETR